MTKKSALQLVCEFANTTKHPPSPSPSLSPSLSLSQGSSSESALQLAASDECRKVLKRAGANGWTPLHVAAEEGDMESLTTLLDDGVCLDEINGVTAIQVLPVPPSGRLVLSQA